MTQQNATSSLRAPVAGLLAWILPGLGHFYLGDRGRGLVLLVVVTATFWSGVAVGGVGATIDPQGHKLWFTAQICTGGNTLAAYALRQQVDRHRTGDDTLASTGYWLSADIGVHYTGVAGLLNILVILDAIGRSDRSSSKRGGKKKVPVPVP